MKKAARRLHNGNDNDQVEYNNTNSTSETKESKTTEVPMLKNIYWKELALLTTVWIVILGLQISKIPVTVGVTLYEAISLYKGKRVIASKGEVVTVSSATATLVMAYSSSMSVVEYYLLRRFPDPYVLYFAAVATVSALAKEIKANKILL
ncbi:hypothetical protein F8388_003568 [Cannabis sativa]|uniref:Uncharacterized protein n=1 Tax=Cannabis sativa TaxID=3483 RepID=A0A7J6EMJ0_CANSA|nr:hypothetical protein F8388_003568 [Cannabis sativa]